MPYNNTTVRDLTTYPIVYNVPNKDLIKDLIKIFGKEIVLKWCLEKTLTLIVYLDVEDNDDDNFAAGIDLYHVINDLYDDEQLPKNKAILNRLYDRFYKAYASKYKKKFEGIDLKIDPITCDIIHLPAYIKTDWDINCKIVYSLKTILNFCAIKIEYESFDVDEHGNDIYYEKRVPLDHYISPYTKVKFYTSDIICVKLDLLKN